MRKKEIGLKLSGYSIIKIAKNCCAKKSCFFFMRDHICFFQKTEAISKNLMMTFFKRFLKFLRE